MKENVLPISTSNLAEAQALLVGLILAKIEIGLKDYLEEVKTFEACSTQKPNTNKQRDTGEGGDL